MEAEIISCIGKKGANLGDGSFCDNEWTSISNPLDEDELEKFSKYEMNHPKRGIALIINIENFKNPGLRGRVGAAKDCRHFCDVLKWLGFETRVFCDLTLAEIWREIDEVAKEDHTNNDCLLIAVMTCGEDNDYLYATDYAFKRDQVTERFESDRVPSLAGKPKIFLFEASRGTKLEEGVPCLMCAKALRTTGPVPTGYVSIPTTADYLLVYSSMKGYHSWRHSVNGSWFIQDFCTELNKDGPTKNILSIVTNTLKRVAFTRVSNTSQTYSSGRQQMPVLVSTLTRDLELGIFHDQSKRIQAVLDGVEYDQYKINHKRRGLAVIFNNENFKQLRLTQRCGAAEDGRALCDTLRSIDFEVCLYNDTRVYEMWNVIDLVTKEDHTNHDCLIVAFMTHGEDSDYLYATDYRFKIDDVIERFTSDKVPSLAGKPKIFLFEASRGTKQEESVPCLMSAKEKWTIGPDPIRYVSIPSTADFLIVHSCVEGYVCFRDITEGSWLIQDLCKELKRDAHTKDFVSILTNTLKRIALTRYSTTQESTRRKQQMPVFMSTLTRLLYFYDPQQ